MSNVRDPAFWKRFSMAVHMDEEEQGNPHAYDLKQKESWLGRQQRKTSRRRYVCPLFWLTFFCFVAGVIVVIIWLLKSGVLDSVHIGNGKGVDDSPADTNGDLTRRR